MNIYLERKAKKYVEKCNSPLKEKIKEEILTLAESPLSGKQLHGNLRDFYRVKFSFRGAQYRILYRIEEEDTLIIAAIGTRENFYRKR